MNRDKFVRAVFVQQVGSLQVTIEPEGARKAGAQWRVDPASDGSGDWYNSGDIVPDLSVGDHTVEFKTIEGASGCFGGTWVTPANLVVRVEPDATTTTVGTYTEGSKQLEARVIPGHWNGDVMFLGAVAAALFLTGRKRALRSRRG